MRRVQVGSILAAFLFAVTTSLFAQQGTSEIGGKVMDEQGAVLPGVAVVATNADTGVIREIISGPDGSYFASQMVPGRYRISAKLTGFHTIERSGLVLQVGKALTINVTLAVGGLEETIRVTAESPIVV